MDDLISRQAAIDALGEKPLSWTEDEYELGLQNQWQSDVDAIKALPSAQPERKKGKWRDHQEGDWIYAKCSLCGAVQDNRSNFCPNCGAEME